MKTNLSCCLLIIFLGTVISILCDEIDSEDHAFHHGLDSIETSDEVSADTHDQSKHKDRVLLRDVKTLVFYRNKRTTSRRTHSIHQLSCVGGTAGCKLFTPDMVECKNVGPNSVDKASKINWRCHAEMSDRVRFNHVEVICEGYDYPEDDYILVGSCGLEFTLDYIDPLDYHHHSYFKHMDEHEKDMHHERVRQQLNAQKTKTTLMQQVVVSIVDNVMVISIFSALVLFSFILARYFSARNQVKKNSLNQPKAKGRVIPGYGPLTSAVMTKKAC